MINDMHETGVGAKLEFTDESSYNRQQYSVDVIWLIITLGYCISIPSCFAIA